MNIRDSYIHGADSRGVVKSLYFATSAESVSKADFSANYTTAAGKDLIFLLADTLGTKIGLPIPTLNQNTSGYASSLLTVKSTSTSNHYLTFVDSNNTTAKAESFYTSGDIYFKPSTGVLTVKSVTVNNTFNYSGIGSDTTSNAARKIWFASSSDGTPVVSDNFKYNPSTKTLTVDKISGPTIVIGNTTLYLDGANNVLTPDTVISNTSTNNTIPSSKAVWDAILTGIQANDAMVFKGFLTGGADAAHTAYTPGADRGDTYKVQTAGYINGEYYQVNDTFICTTDGTVAATSSNVNTVKANWGVVEGNGDFLDIHGGTMYGTLSWKDATALPSTTAADYILVASDDNGTKTANYITKADFITDLNIAASSHTHSVKINGSTKTINASGGTAVDLGSYLPLSGGNMTGAIKRLYNSASDDPMISLASRDLDIWLWRISDSLHALSARCGFGLKYLGTGSGNNNKLVLYSDNQTSTLVAAMSMTLDGVIALAKVPNIGGSTVAYAGNVSNKNATIGLTLTELATIAGISIKAKIDIPSLATTLFDDNKTLEVTTWDDIAAINDYDAGTYIIQIKSGSLYASGIFSNCKDTDLIVDEIPLHVSDKVGTWRPYARISGTKLLMTTNEISGVSRKYTVNIIKLL